MLQIKTGQGEDTFFLTENKGVFELLSYEFDSYQIHKRGGGKCTYVSKSGCSREGYIESFNNLIPVGGYRVDLEFNNWQRPVEAKDGIKIMVPYKNHERDKEETLQFNPVVILTGNSIIYCGYYTTMNDVLRTLFSGREFEMPPTINRRTFVDIKSKKEEIIEFNFYNFFGYAPYSPMEFTNISPYELTKENSVYIQKRAHMVLGVKPLIDGTFVRTYRIGGKLYATEWYEKDPLENLCLPEMVLKGWSFGAPNCVYKFRKDHVYIVAWHTKLDGTQLCLEKEVRRLFFIFNKEYVLNEVHKELVEQLKE